MTQARSWRDGGRGGAGGPLVIAHRGASAHEPENSLAAFARAAADGADGVELDVLRCATGEVVVFHDDDLQRLAGRPERIDALTFAAVRAVRLQSGATIPTLAEALEACGPDLLVNVELKAERATTHAELGALVAAVAAAVARARAEPRVLVSSFHPWAVAFWRRRAPAVPAALLFEHKAALPLRGAWALPVVRPFAVHPEHDLCTPKSVARWHRRGYRVNVWTVDDAARLRELRDMGVDGVISNDPAAARVALGTIG